MSGATGIPLCDFLAHSINIVIALSDFAYSFHSLRAHALCTYSANACFLQTGVGPKSLLTWHSFAFCVKNYIWSTSWGTIMLHVQTAAKDHSVWRGLGEKTFMGNVESLVTPTGKVAGSVQIYKDRGLSTGNDRGSDYVLPFGAERQLANDFAFVAAAEASAKAVSAITITENVGGKGMIIRIAVNQTISPNVNNALRVMCHKLQQRSQGG